MTQRYAIVPVVGEFTDAAGRTEIDISGVYGDLNGFHLSSFGSGKVTREQIDAAAKAIGLRDGYIEGETGTVEEFEYYRQDAIVGFRAIGLEVEEQK